MRFGLFFCSLLTALNLNGSTSLYEALKSLPPSPYTTSSKKELETYTKSKKPLASTWSTHYMKALLKRPFPLYDPTLEMDYVVEDINVNKVMSPEARALTEDTVYIQVAMISAIGVLVLLPESVSNWDLDQLQKKPLDERWKEHVAAGPVWDKDDWAINYIGHPISGAVYYTMARNDGMDIMESALFSTVMSTFFWEYGYEAFAEVPSIQDIIFTPLLGSFLGEGMHILELKLDENGGKLWGFKGLGSFSYFWLDPMGNIAGGLSDMLNVSVTMEFSNFQHYQDPSHFRYSNDQADPVRFQDRDYGFMLTFY